MEGNINKVTSEACKRRGERPCGDLVPWSLASQFLNTSLTELVGVRVVRIATHPDYQVRHSSLEYGTYFTIGKHGSCYFLLCSDCFVESECNLYIKIQFSCWLVGWFVWLSRANGKADQDGLYVKRTIPATE